MADSEMLRDAAAAIVDALDAMDLSNRGDRQPATEIADSCAVVQRWRLELEAGRWSGRSVELDVTHRVERNSEDAP